MTAVFDASALLAYLQGERGSHAIATRLHAGGYCGAANWSEVAQKVAQAGGDWRLASDVLLSLDLRVEDVTRDDAEAAAALWARGSGLPLGDRLCLALAERLDADAVTMDAAWKSHPRATLIR